MVQRRLCLTCSSSAPPKASWSFTTECCGRDICDACLIKNPRLRLYNPCLACLNGVGASSSSSSSRSQLKYTSPANVSASVHNGTLENDMFVLGDDDEDDNDGQGTPFESSRSLSAVGAPPSYEATVNAASGATQSAASLPSQSLSSPSPVTDFEGSSIPSAPSLGAGLSAHISNGKYHIQPGDTLSSLSLKLGVDGRRLARLNNLPPSTLSTTPHILHTRRFLNLPSELHHLSSDHSAPHAESKTEEDAARARERARERAAKRFAFVTKEVDYRVAKTYVALAELADEDPHVAQEHEDRLAAAKKEGALSCISTGAEAFGVTTGAQASTGTSSSHMRHMNARTSSQQDRAVDSYLEDEEWEREQRRAGQNPRPRAFPFIGLRKA